MKPIPATQIAVDASSQRHVLPKNLRKAVKQLSDAELELLHSPALEEMGRRGRSPPSDQTRKRSSPTDTSSRKRLVEAAAVMLAARAVTSTIPIVFVSGGDPIASGLVTNLSRPGGNITGMSFASVPLQPKRLGLLHELVPPPATIAWLRDPRDPSFEGQEKEVPPAARELGRQLLALNAQSVGEIDAAFATIVQSRAGALLVGAGALFNNRRRQVAALAARHGVPAIGGIREFVLAGGLMSYGASDSDAYRRAGSHYVG